MADLLIVEDDETIAQSVAAVLSSEGHTVRVAENGAEGLRALSDGLPALILLDVEMPVLTGPGMAGRMLIEDAGRERISNRPGERGRRSAWGRGHRRDAVRAAKPCKLDTLLRLVNRALAERVAPSPRVRPLNLSSADERADRPRRPRSKRLGAHPIGSAPGYLRFANMARPLQSAHHGIAHRRLRFCQQPAGRRARVEERLGRLALHAAVRLCRVHGGAARSRRARVLVDLSGRRRA